MVNRIVRWVVIAVALVLFVLLKARIGLVPAAVISLATLLIAPTVMLRLGARRDADRTTQRPRD